MADRILGPQAIILTDEEIRVCTDFSKKSAPTQQRVEYGNSRTKPRTSQEIARDNLIGKLAEVAYTRFWKEKFGIELDLDFDVYPQGVWDKGDITFADYPADIKATRSGGHWLLVELNKLEFRKHENRLPFCFMFATTDWDRMKDVPTGRVVLQGFALLRQICHPERIGVRSEEICRGIKDTLFLPEGSLIPYTQTHLQADNCARHMNHLLKDWQALLNSVPRRQP